MGLLNDLKPPTHIPACRVRTVLATLDAADKKILIEALDNLEWSAFGLHKALKSRGIDMSDRVISVHRRKKCSCDA